MGAPSVLESSKTSGVAPDQSTPPPTRITGRLASANILAEALIFSSSGGGALREGECVDVSSLDEIPTFSNVKKVIKLAEIYRLYSWEKV